MKQTLLLFFFFLSLSLSASSQSIGERLAINSPQAEQKENITIYPNPATTHIGLSSSDGVERIIVFNMVGRQMKNFQVGEGDKRYYVGDLPRGMYLIQLLSANNEVLTTKRVSKR